MEIYSNSDFDGTSHADMVELGQNPHQSGGAYYRWRLLQRADVAAAGAKPTVAAGQAAADRGAEMEKLF